MAFQSLILYNRIFRLLDLISTFLYTHLYKHRFFDSKKVSIGKGLYLEGGQYIRIGNNSRIGKHAVITAWRSFHGILYNPYISIGMNSNIGEYVHITCINRIEIGDNLLTGRNVTITDNSHGMVSADNLAIPPLSRILISKGSIKIGNNVWIGDKVTILPDVEIGDGAIIGANSVVTKNIPKNCVAVGNPVRIIRQF